MEKEKTKIIAIDDRIKDLKTLLEHHDTFSASFGQFVEFENGYRVDDKETGISLDLFKYFPDKKHVLIKSIENNCYDLIFMDYHLGDDQRKGIQEGLEAIRLIADTFPELPIIVITGRATFRDAQQEAILRCVDIFSKTNSDDIVNLLCDNEKVLKYLKKNILMRAINHETKPRLPIKYKYDYGANKIIVTGVLSPLKIGYMNSLGISITKHNSDEEKTYFDKMTYRELLMREKHLEIDGLCEQNISWIELKAILRGKEMPGVKFRCLKKKSDNPDSTHYLKNLFYMDWEYLCAHGEMH